MTEVGRTGEMKERKIRLIPMCCLGSRADKGLSGLHILGLRKNSEETLDNEFYSETGWGRWRGKSRETEGHRETENDGKQRQKGMEKAYRRKRGDRDKDTEQRHKDRERQRTEGQTDTHTRA